MKETGIPDKLTKYPFPRKPPGAPSAYYLWHGCLESRYAHTRIWIKALESYLQELEDERKS